LAVGGEKVIDGTYSEVLVVARDGTAVLLDTASATAAVVASVFGLALKALRCPRCKAVHLDTEEFAVTPHRKHQCNRCGRPFFDPGGQRSISNPAAALRALEGSQRPRPVPAEGHLRVVTKECSDISVWGSNSALLWTSPIPEEEGIHVHAASVQGHYVVDDTFASLDIDGVELDATQLRAFMVQQSLRHLNGRVVAIDCPTCGLAHFDGGISALTPTTSHRCAGCGTPLVWRGRMRRVVANPVVALLQRLGGTATSA
jgi:hypothetical protein